MNKLDFSLNGKPSQGLGSPDSVKGSTTKQLVTSTKVLSTKVPSTSTCSLYGDVTPPVTPALQKVTKRNISFDNGSSERTLESIASSLSKDGWPSDQIHEFLNILALKVCAPGMVKQESIEEIVGKVGKKERNLTQEVRDILSVTQGNISVTFLAKELQSVTKEERTRLRVAIHRLVAEGLLEPTKRVAGEYRVVSKEYEIVDLMKIESGNLSDIVLPFELRDIVDIYPKDLIVYAGAPNTGKTALMLETVRLNMDKHKCWYFSTEMGRYNARDRLAKHKECTDWNFQFVDEVPNYLDVIRPEAVNFIDYVEVDMEGSYYKIAGILAAIQKRLSTGIAFVALQKKSGSSYAMGGEQTKAKASLFCAIDEDYPDVVIRLEKAKNFRGVNPNGYMRKFNIEAGINLKAKSMWQPEY